MLTERTPCPVCGHPPGDCTGPNSAPKHVIGPNIFPSLGHEETVVVEEDIFEVRPITSFTSARVLVCRAGSAISLTEAKRLGIR
jgi:hypothetical protein